MPEVKTEVMGNGSAWALWHISESEQELAFIAMESCPEDVVAPSKRKNTWPDAPCFGHWLKKLAAYMKAFEKDDYGKPFLKNQPFEISLSHSSPYVAAQIHPSLAVGIDIEQPKAKLLRIASRVMSPEEEKDAGDDIVKHCIYWCAKEVMYKIHGKRGLHFNSQLNLAPFELESSGDLQGKITDGAQQTVRLAYRVKSDYVMVYTKHDA